MLNKVLRLEGLVGYQSFCWFICTKKSWMLDFCHPESSFLRFYLDDTAVIFEYRHLSWAYSAYRQYGKFLNLGKLSLNSSIDV
jgi:hypothetical protein